MKHDTYDEFWKARNLRPHLKNIKPAVMTVGGWFDAENLFGALETYRAVEKQSPGGTNTLVMGPWLHGGWSRNDGDPGRRPLRCQDRAHYREQIELPFFRRTSRARRTRPRRKRTCSRPAATSGCAVLVAARRRQADALLPRERPFVVRPADGRNERGRAHPTRVRRLVSDPRKPVPFIEDVQIGMAAST